MSEPSPIRLGFVGAGTMGQLAHLANYVGLPGVSLVALAEGRRELAAQVAARYGVAEVCENHRQLCERDDLDAVVAIAHFGLNYGLASDLLATGKHVLTEKSLSIRTTAADALVAAAARAQRVYQVAYMKRCDPGVRLARDTIAAWRAGGELGPLQLARIWCCEGDWLWHIESPLRSAEPVPAYAAAPEPPQTGEDDASLGWVVSWLNYYSHQTNLLRYLLGEDYQVAYHDAWSGGDVVVAHSESGVRALLEFHKFRVSGWDEGFELVFRQGTVRGRLAAPMARQRAAVIEIERHDGRGGVEQPYVPPVWAMRAQAEAFVAAVRGGECLSPASEAAKEVHLAWQLAKTGCRA